MYLKKVGGVFYFHARVPKDLVALVRCKEVKKSLRTGDRTIARSAAKAYALELERIAVYSRSGFMDERQLQLAMQRLKDGYLLGVKDTRDRATASVEVLAQPIPGLDGNYGFNQVVNLFDLDDPDIVKRAGERIAALKDKLRETENENVADAYRDAISAIDERLTAPQRARLDYKRLAKSVAEELIPGAVFTDATRRETRQFIRENGLEVELPPDGWFNENDDAWFDPVKGDFRKVALELLRTKQEIYEVELQRLQGNYRNAYDAQARRRRPQYFLSQAVEDFCKERRIEKSVNNRTHERYCEYFTVIMDLLGDQDVTAYTRRDLEDLKSRLYERPANASKNPKHIKLLDKRTVNTNYMSKIAALFKWLYVKDRVDKDLTAGLVSSLSAKEKTAAKRKPYDGDDLKKIFDLIPFNRKQPHLAWVPLLAAYTGARQGELCQLLVIDVAERDGIPYLNITDEDEQGKVVKSIKNENSRRPVPLHPTLIELGFLDFVMMRREQGAVVLFESKIRDKAGHKPLTGQYYSKLFQSFNRKNITDDPKKVFHSFRHLVQNELKQKGVTPAVYHSIVGHSSDHEMEAVYTEDYSLQIKFEALKKLEYPTLNLAELKTKYSRVIGAI